MAQANPRNARLTQLFIDVLHGKRNFDPSSDSTKFLKALTLQSDPIACLERLLASDTGSRALKLSLRHDTSLPALNGFVSDLLNYLADREIMLAFNGSLIAQVLSIFFSVERIWNALSEQLTAGNLNDKATTGLAWLMYAHLTLSDPISTKVLADAHRVTEHGVFLKHELLECRVYGQKIQHFLSLHGQPAHSPASDGPGGRHDNDHTDFRQIAIFPTADEVFSKEKSFYQSMDEVLGSAPDGRVASYISNQFRLLREDMLHELREDMQRSTGGPSTGRKSFKLSGIKLVALDSGTASRWKRCTIQVTADRGLERLKGKSQKQRRAYLNENTYFLKHSSLGYILDGNKIVTFVTVLRDVNLELEPPQVTLRLCSEDSWPTVLKAFKRSSSLSFLQVDTPYFAYESVLRCLQTKKEVPLVGTLLDLPTNEEQHDIVDESIVQRIAGSAGQDLQSILKTSMSIKPDAAQLDSLIAALVSNVSLIQGPPGTGKSFIGALIAKALLHYSSEKILVLCYTNHALDQTLEQLMDTGIPHSEFVRLGAKSTDRTAPLNIQNIRPSQPRKHSTRELINSLEQKLYQMAQIVENTFQDYSQGHISLADLMMYLEFSDENNSFFQALSLPMINEDDEMTLVGRKGRQITDTYLIERWVAGQDPGIFTEMVDSFPQAWHLEKSARVDLITKWKQEILEEKISGLHCSIDEYNCALERWHHAKSDFQANILKEKRIIGATTSGAAKYTDALQAAQPGIIIIEEAGEILESHILASISTNTKKLILIGDHKQLRPKISCYDLSVEHGSGYDLNRSLFERLVLSGFPHTTLSEQHRMCPEISSLIRHLTYPELTDAPKTLTRSKLRGLTDRVIFFNHEHMEVLVDGIADRRDNGAKVSKRNSFEAEIVLKCVRYMAQQGYGSDKLVVLTPYLGQLRQLRETLSVENDPVLNDLDSYDLIQAGLLSPAAARSQKRPLKLSTIDNYQGEESDIVIASLTRSNPDGDIGFMSQPERLNVLLSRARECLIMVGNVQTFLSSRRGKRTWAPFFEKMREKGHIYDGFPIRCEQHPQRTALLKSAEDFDIWAPQGGCLEPCGTILSCGIHACPQKCHQLYDHSKMPCDIMVHFTCPRSHASSHKCSVTRVRCEACQLEDEAIARREARDRKLEIARLAKVRAYATEMAEIKAEKNHCRKIRQDDIDERLRQAELRKSRNELNDMQRSAQRASASKSEDQNKVNGDAPDMWQISQDSAAADEWEELKRTDGAFNAQLDDLMKMVGLESIKHKFLEIKDTVDLSIMRGDDLKSVRFGATFLGNPGTGKTTVARMYAKFLASVGCIPGSKFVETTGSKLAHEGINGCQKMIEAIENSGGGVLFIDEAYQLIGASAMSGKQVLDYILAEVENQTGKIAFIVAGYNKQMEDFFTHNPGLPSRFPIKLKFEDYDDEELRQIFTLQIMKKTRNRAEVEEGLDGRLVRIVARRVGRGRGREGFGNARAMENMSSRVFERQATRLRREKRAKSGKPVNLNLLSKEDLLGPHPSTALQTCKAWSSLKSLIGLSSVKTAVQSLVDMLDFNLERELNEEPIVEMSLNKIFLGSPGTGKTSVAKLYGQILVDLGMLSNGEVIMKNPSDFVGNVIGGSEAQTKAILQASVGKVLVIDEAYGLYGGAQSNHQTDIFRTAVIDTIVSEVQSTANEDRCVLLLGYKEQMEDMMNNVNPGLSRRFPLGSAFVFEDFSDAELEQILDLKLKQCGFTTTTDGKIVAMEVLNRARNRPNFGNGGEVDILLDKAKASHQSRFTQKATSNPSELEEIDFDPEYDRLKNAATNIDMLFRHVVGCENIVVRLKTLQQTVAKSKALGLDPRDSVPFTYLFRGPPGTGKTTTAQKMGKVYYDMGFLATAEVEECSATALVGEYVGQTGPKTQKLLDRATGKVLFIDEAYRLADGHFGKEAMDEIVDCLTKPRYMNKLIVILAGYDQDINRLMTMNPGLTSRFPHSINFRPLNAKECLHLMLTRLKEQQAKLSKVGSTLDMVVLEGGQDDFLHSQILNVFSELVALPNWANGRDVITLAKHVFNSTLLAKDEQTPMLTVPADCVLEHMNLMLRERRQRLQAGPVKVQDFNLPAQGQGPTLDLGINHDTNASLAAAAGETTAVDADQATGGGPEQARDEGVSDETWAKLQHDTFGHDQRQKVFVETLRDEKNLEKNLEILNNKAPVSVSTAATATDYEAKRLNEESRLKHLAAIRAVEEELERVRKLREEEEERRKEEAAVQRKIRELGLCVAGFRWIKQSTGYRCAGGSHFLSNDQLGL